MSFYPLKYSNMHCFFCYFLYHNNKNPSNIEKLTSKCLIMLNDKQILSEI